MGTRPPTYTTTPCCYRFSRGAFYRLLYYQAYLSLLPKPERAYEDIQTIIFYAEFSTSVGAWKHGAGAYN
jgi:hypothetical protein